MRYCRPFVDGIAFAYQYYINPNSSSHIELGTSDFPFKDFAAPAKEIFNFMYENTTNATMYVSRGTSMFLYYGIMPMILLNLQNFTMVGYGNETLARPRIFVTDIPYQWPDSSLFYLEEDWYQLSLRVQRGDMSTSEASSQFQKYYVFRSSLSLFHIDFQSIMFSDAWSNPLVFTFSNLNKTIHFNDCYFDLDGALEEGYHPISSILENSVINITDFQYGIWLDFRWDCVANNAEYAQAFYTLRNV